MKKINTIVRLAQSISVNKGEGDASLLHTLYAQGFEEKALIELINLITLRIFTNYVFAVTITIDFPKVITI